MKYKGDYQQVRLFTIIDLLSIFNKFKRQNSFSLLYNLFIYPIGRSPYHNVNKNGSNSGSLPQNNSWDSPSQNSDFSSHSCLTNGNSGSSNGHSRNPSNASSCSSSLSDSLTRSVGDVFKGFIIAVHRKMVSLWDKLLFQIM